VLRKWLLLPVDLTEFGTFSILAITECTYVQMFNKSRDINSH